MEKVLMKIPSKPQYLQVLRLTTASLANRMGFDIDAIEDLKVLISEVVTYALPINDELEIIFEMEEERITIKVVADKVSYSDEKLEQEMKMKKQILSSLADDILFEDECISIIMNR